MNDYLTVKNQGLAEIEIKRSRFIAYSENVSSNDEAISFINKIRAKHPDAKHNVYAYTIRKEQIKRYSDDGEPQGTAGMPVLDVLQKEGITDCAVVVTRYFGGILLGTGGLVRAYSHAAKLAVDNACIIKMGLCSVMSILCEYDFYSVLNNILNEYECIINNTEFTDKVRIDFTVDDKKSESLNAEIFDVSKGKYKADKIDIRFSEMKL